MALAVDTPGMVAGGGPRRWADGYRRMLVWEFVSLRLYLPVLTAVLVLQGAGFVFGIGLFFRHIPTTAAVYVATGVPVVNLMTVGLIFEPQIVADERASGSYEFIRALPVARTARFLAWYTIALLIALPAVVVSLAVGVARYHFDLHLTPGIVPAVVMTSLTGTLVGYAVAHAINVPMVIRLVSVSMIFMIFGFSPVTFPAGQLPAWLRSTNRWLPFESMATVVRSSLVRGLTSGTGRAYVVLAAWGVGSAAIAAWSIGRRR
jgi:ABC-2 type transport system permease protein